MLKKCTTCGLAFSSKRLAMLIAGVTLLTRSYVHSQSCRRNNLRNSTKDYEETIRRTARYTGTQIENRLENAYLSGDP
jgi:hypothetical protein